MKLIGEVMRWIWRRRWLFVLLGVPGLVVCGFVGLMLWVLSDLFEVRTYILPVHDGEITEADAKGLLEYRDLAARLKGMVPLEDEKRCRPGERWLMFSDFERNANRLTAVFRSESSRTEIVRFSRQPGDTERGQIHVSIYNPH